MDIKRLRVGTKVKILRPCCGPFLDGDEVGILVVVPKDGDSYWFSPNKPNAEASKLTMYEDGTRHISIGSDLTNFKVLKY